MTIYPVRIALIVVGLGLILSQAGCATRGYVDTKCRLAVQLARTEAICDQANINEPLFEKVSELQQRIKFMERKTEVGRVASARTKEEIISDKIRTGEAIDKATEDYRQILRDCHRASIQIVEELSK